MFAVLNRLKESPKQTLGHFSLYDRQYIEFSCVTLELPDKDNQKRISRIPRGLYRCMPRYSPKYGHHFELMDVSGRSLILIHFGNYHEDTLGCILVGEAFTDIDKDGDLDITSSKRTMNRLLDITQKKQFWIAINDYDNFE